MNYTNHDKIDLHHFYCHNNNERLQNKTWDQSLSKK